MTNSKKLFTPAQHDAFNYLKKVIKKDTSLIINIHSVSASGMTRKMSVYIIQKNRFSKQQELKRINWHLSQIGAVSLDANGQIKVGGCGMDMAFWLQDHVKHAIFSRKKYCADLPQIWQTI